MERPFLKVDDEEIIICKIYIHVRYFQTQIKWYEHVHIPVSEIQNKSKILNELAFNKKII